MEKSLFKNKASAAFYICVFAVMLLFNFLTPLIADDYQYSFSFENGARITSLSQIIPSLIAHRSIMNGRVLAHLFTHLFLMLPKAVFNMINALDAVLLLWLMERYAPSGDNCRRVCRLAFAAAALWVFLPAFGQSCLWLDGACNYTWSVTVFLAFLLPYADAYLSRPVKRSRCFTGLFLVLAFAAGSYSENGSVAAIFTAVCLTVMTAARERRWDLRSLAGIVAACAGFALLMSAPAELNGRAGDFSLAMIGGNIRYIVATAKEKLLPLYCVYAALLCLAALCKADRRKLWLSAVLLVGGLAAIAPFAFAAYFTMRHFTCTAFFTVTACMILFEELWSAGRAKQLLIVSSVLATVFLFDFALGAIDIITVFKDSCLREASVAEALERGEGEAELIAYRPYTDYPAVSGLMDVESGEFNGLMAKYYGLDSISAKTVDENEYMWK